jgi:hypothetical protein
MVLFLLMPKNDTVSNTDVTQRRKLQVWFVHWNWFPTVEKMFRSEAVHARFVMENLALGQVFTLGALDFPVGITPQLCYTHPFILYRRHTT